MVLKKLALPGLRYLFISVTFATCSLFLTFFCFVFDLGILKCAKHNPYIYKHSGQLYNQAGCL